MHNTNVITLFIVNCTMKIPIDTSSLRERGKNIFEKVLQVQLPYSEQNGELTIIDLTKRSDLYIID